jgi:hypothetical protein
LQSTQPAKAGLWYLKSIALAGRMADRDADRNYVAQLDQSLAAVLVRPEQIRERLRRLQEANTIRQEQTRTIAAGPCTDVPDAIVVRFERCRERSRSPGADTPDREFRAATAPGVQPNVSQPVGSAGCVSSEEAWPALPRTPLLERSELCLAAVVCFRKHGAGP